MADLQKVPCGGFELDSSLKLTDNKLGVAGGGIYYLKINAEQVGSSSWEYSIAEDSQLKTYEEIVECIENGNIIRCNKSPGSLFTDIIFQDDTAILEGFVLRFVQQNTVYLSGTMITFNKDSTIKFFTQRSMNITQ